MSDLTANESQNWLDFDEWPEEPDLSGWESLRGPVAWAYNILREEGGDDEKKVADDDPIA